MRYFVLILYLVQLQVHASDWLNRTVRVDLITNRKDFDPQYDLFERSEIMSSAVNATNGQFPWSIMTTAWTFIGSTGIGTTCTGTVISNNFVVNDLRCVGQDHVQPVSTIEASIGSVQWNSTRSPTNFVRHYWYITPSPENSPNIVLFRLHEALTLNPNVQPIRLPSHGNFSYEGWSSHIMGFHAPPGTFSAQLTSVHSSILNNRLCNFNGNAPDHEMCASEGGDPSESGPVMRFNAFSGGAWIVYEYTAGSQYSPILIGIHQYQFSNETASFGYATRVSHFLEWIQTLSVDGIK